MARSFKRRTGLSGISELNVTPLIDLAFALLIIFMITAPLLEQSIQIQLPEEALRPAEAGQVDTVELSIDYEGQVYFNGEAVGIAALVAELDALAGQTDPPVVRLRADARLSYQVVIDVLALLKERDLTRISLETRAY